jgi:hypothetical protein
MPRGPGETAVRQLGFGIHLCGPLSNSMPARLATSATRLELADELIE